MFISLAKIGCNYYVFMARKSLLPCMINLFRRILQKFQVFDIKLRFKIKNVIFKNKLKQHLPASAPRIIDLFEPSDQRIRVVGVRSGPTKTQNSQNPKLTKNLHVLSNVDSVA